MWVRGCGEGHGKLRKKDNVTVVQCPSDEGASRTCVVVPTPLVATFPVLLGTAAVLASDTYHRHSSHEKRGDGCEGSSHDVAEPQTVFRSLVQCQLLYECVMKCQHTSRRLARFFSRSISLSMSLPTLAAEPRLPQVRVVGAMAKPKKIANSLLPGGLRSYGKIHEVRGPHRGIRSST